MDDQTPLITDNEAINAFKSTQSQEPIPDSYEILSQWSRTMIRGVAVLK